MILEAQQMTRQLKAAAVAAISTYEKAPSQRRLDAARLAVQDCSVDANSLGRLPIILDLIEGAPPEIFWPDFMEAWTLCDNTWQDRKRILRALEAQTKREPALRFFSQTNREFFDALPALVPVFRGCSRPRVRALSWTTDQSVADRFAYGHRRIPVPEPVVAFAIIPKEHILFVSIDRKEREVILRPWRLRKLIVNPYMARP
jgi:hypothetical protein